MHELALAESVLHIIETTATRESLITVHEVVLEIGELAAVEPEAMQFCFDSVVLGTVAEGAQLRIVTKAGEGCCSDCNRTTWLNDWHLLCPQCGGTHIRITGGDRMRVLEIAGK